ncbi:MAG: hypothetical protein C4346_05375 [Chloroflexota bacterium]
MSGQMPSWTASAAITDRVIADAKRVFRDVADEQVIERLTREAVAELCDDSIKVTAFVPVLAMRRVRDLIADQAIVQRGAADRY